MSAYARLLVERCVDVQAGWEVLVVSSPLARPLVDEIVRAIARRNAFPTLRINFSQWSFPVDPVWVEHAPVELIRELPSIERETFLTCDARIVVHAPENAREGAGLEPAKMAALREAFADHAQRVVSFEYPWVGCQYPVPAYAQDAGMTLRAFEDFLFGACLLDWDALAASMRPIKERFDRAREVRLVGDGTDLTFSLEGREGMIDDGKVNMPGGEVFYSPVEDSAEGVVTFAEFPAVYFGNEVTGVRLRFEGGRVVEASARTNEDALLDALDTDEGARRLGEFGIGCNPGITRHMRNTLYDEKIDGTIHLAVGAGFPFIGGSNESRVHWDMVKDLRDGGRIECDGEVVQESGSWR